MMFVIYFLDVPIPDLQYSLEFSGHESLHSQAAAQRPPASNSSCKATSSMAKALRSLTCQCKLCANGGVMEDPKIIPNPKIAMFTG